MHETPAPVNPLFPIRLCRAIRSESFSPQLFATPRASREESQRFRSGRQRPPRRIWCVQSGTARRQSTLYRHG